MKKLALTTLFAVSIPVAFTGAVQAEQPNVVLNADGTKPHIQYPIDAKTQAIIDEKVKLVKMHKEAKEGKRSMADVDKAVEAFEKKVGVKKEGQIRPTRSNKVAEVGINAASQSYNYIYDLYQQTQWNWYYCGPATVSSILNAKEKSIDQGTAAAYMGTTTNGTDWYNGTYPVRDALNYYTGTNYYAPYGTTVNAATFKDYVTYDIDRDWGVAADGWEVPGGPHLVGHPNTEIFHWFAIDGYSNWGDSTHYADSASGCSQISWSGSVPRYSTMSTTTVATIVDGRGIIW
jgi:hypothetical protein